MIFEIVERASRDGLKYAVKVTRPHWQKTEGYIFRKNKFVQIGMAEHWGYYDERGFPDLHRSDYYCCWFLSRHDAEHLLDLLQLKGLPDRYVTYDRPFTD